MEYDIVWTGDNFDEVNAMFPSTQRVNCSDELELIVSGTVKRVPKGHTLYYNGETILVTEPEVEDESEVQA